MRRIEQLAQRESYRQEQRKDLEPVDQPAEVRGDQHPPLLAIERPIPRQLWLSLISLMQASRPGNTRVKRATHRLGQGSKMMSTRRSVTVGSFEPVWPIGSCRTIARAMPSASS
jgi:hypothetical protein